MLKIFLLFPIPFPYLLCKYIGTYNTEVNFQMKCTWEQAVCPFSREKRERKREKKTQRWGGWEGNSAYKLIIFKHNIEL